MFSPTGTNYIVQLPLVILLYVWNKIKIKITCDHKGGKGWKGQFYLLAVASTPFTQSMWNRSELRLYLSHLTDLLPWYPLDWRRWERVTQHAMLRRAASCKKKSCTQFFENNLWSNMLMEHAWKTALHGSTQQSDTFWIQMTS